MDHGQIIALDIPSNLISKQNLDSAVEFTLSNATKREFLERLPLVNKVTQDGDRFIIYTKEALLLLVEIVRLYQQKQLDLANISVRAATLEDVFLELTGRRLRE
jgi:ABC-2 type transport system ATP-binding protein